jgi:probable rRNA maturation factor
MIIEIQNQQKKVPIPRSQIKRIAQKILRHEDISRANLSIVFVTDAQIQSLNKKFLHRSYATDVLAFALGSGKKPRAPKQIEGEVVISAPMARKNAKAFKTSVRHELVLYVIHGILHLLGHDDHRPADIRRMRAKEAELMTLCLSSKPKRSS